MAISDSVVFFYGFSSFSILGNNTKSIFVTRFVCINRVRFVQSDESTENNNSTFNVEFMCFYRFTWSLFIMSLNRNFQIGSISNSIKSFQCSYFRNKNKSLHISWFCNFFERIDLFIWNQYRKIRNCASIWTQDVAPMAKLIFLV